MRFLCSTILALSFVSLMPFAAAAQEVTPEMAEPATGSAEATAMFEAGTVLMGTESYAEGAVKFRQACDLGHAAACGSLGALTLAGQGTQKNSQAAIALMTKACNLNDSSSCVIAGILQAGGQAYDEANTLLQRACDLKNGDGCVELGMLHYQGLGVEPDPEAGARKFSKGCSYDSADACYSYGAHLVNAEGPRAYAMARIFMKKALKIDPNHEGAKNALAQLDQ